MVTRSSQLIRVLEIAKRAAKSNATILIQAESGTGKELLAKTIWEHSQRSQAPLVAVNCAALPDNLLESELFGFEKGSFTGAMHSKPGKFELADGGTLILDEIGEMPLHLQAKILRVLQEQEVDRIGGKSPLSVDVRVIAITNQNLKQQIQEGKFREDLFFRLNVIPLTIPALRHRPEDVAPLVAHFLQRYQGPNTLDPEAERFVRTYHWPGNVRELENMIQRASVLALGDEVRLQDLVLSDQVTHQPSVTLEGPRSGSESMLEDPFRLRAGLTVQEMERKLIEVTLAETNGNRTRAAEFLGISLRTLRNKLNEYKSSNS
jgi:two-component system response regulator FlrC